MIYSVQYLRGLAAIMVVWFHASESLSRLGMIHFSSKFGWAGVDLFFVISGFIMVVAIEKSHTPSQFILRRIFRVVPLYWAVTSFVVLVSVIAPSLLKSTKFDPSHVLASFAFVPWQNPTYPGMFPVVIPGWTLNYEMGFYAVLALALLLARRQPFLLSSTILVGLTLLGVAAGFEQPVLRFYSDPIILEFALGMIAGKVYMSSLTAMQQAVLAAGIASLIFVAFVYWGQHRIFSGGIFAFFFVIALSGIEKRFGFPKIPALKVLGDASYSIYLVHPLLVATIVVIARAVNFPSTDLATIAMLFFIFALVILIGIIVYRTFELPVTRALNKSWQSRSPSPLLKW